MSTSIHHPRIQLEEVRQRYRGALTVSEVDGPPYFVCSPVTIAAEPSTNKERHRVSSRGNKQCDAVWWSITPPAFSYSTKFGGSPFGNGSFAWPQFEGEPMSFIAQFCFLDSLDLFDGSEMLARNVLQVFGECSRSGDTELGPAIATRWQSLDDRTERGTKAQQQGIILPEMAGVLCRLTSNDFIGQTADYVSEGISTRIGSVTGVIQRPVSGKLIASLATFFPRGIEPGEFVNPALPVGEELALRHGFNIGDYGVIQFVLRRDHTVEAIVECF